jgi:L,D-transpeptidase ErfK/SrfK
MDFLMPFISPKNGFLPSVLGFFLLFFGMVAVPLSNGLAYQPSWTILSEVQGGEQWYHVQPRDSLYAISGRFGTTWQYLAKRNNLNLPYKLSPGQKLVVNSRHVLPFNDMNKGLLLNIPEHGLYLIKEGVVIKRYAVGLGRTDWPTPTGVFSITGKTKNPTWTVPKSIQEEMKREGKSILEKVPPGPENPLGAYWLPLSVPGYGIHATIWPESIGHSTSHGCIRMITEDIEDLYGRITPGTPIVIVYEPLKMAVTPEKRIYLEVHSNTYRKEISYWNYVQKLAGQNGLSDRIDWPKVTMVLNERNGIAEEITRK